MMEVKNITKFFGSLQVLKGISLQVEQGEILTIMGPSGAGKTTLLQVMGTLSRPDSGAILFQGESVTGLDDRALAIFRNRQLGFVFQFHHLLPEFTALENVCMPAFIAGVSKSEAEERGKELLDFLNLTERIHHKPGELSGGERQRVAVARALMNQPGLILADEPSGNLDSENQRELHKLFFRLRDELGQTFVIVTHDANLAQLSDRVLTLRDGLIIHDSAS
ncbi:MAG: ABC transporter ATP-binding protein [Bacteroidales bacterium]|nr:ABC transporter ATP-binding protein [Bacteroidales bacterium]